MRNQKLAWGLQQKKEEPDALSRNEKKQIQTAFRGAFATWLRSLLGNRAFVFALLRYGISDFADLRRCAEALRHAPSDDGDISQSATHTPNPELRHAAVSARRQERDAKKYAKWAREKGWACSPWQQRQIMLLNSGKLAEQVRSANAAYGFGKGTEEALSREQAMMLHARIDWIIDSDIDQS